MGCDIHIFIEAKSPKTDEWYSIGEFEAGGFRNYAFFGLMADIRTPIGVRPMFKSKGFPDDVNQLSVEQFDDLNDFGNSWLDCDEYRTLLNECKEQDMGALMPMSQLGDILESLKMLGAVDSRIVFWFDA